MSEGRLQLKTRVWGEGAQPKGIWKWKRKLQVALEEMIHEKVEDQISDTGLASPPPVPAPDLSRAQVPLSAVHEAA